MSNVVLRGATSSLKELPRPRGFQIGVTLDTLLTFLNQGILVGTLRWFKGARGEPGVKCGFKGWQ